MRHHPLIFLFSCSSNLRRSFSVPLRDVRPPTTLVLRRHAVRDDIDTKDAIELIDAKSYPDEVLGNGCQVTPASRSTIERALDATASWLGITRPASWMGARYQSANRIAHVHFLREQLGVEAYMVKVCFVGDPRMPTTDEEWGKAKDDFRQKLQIGDVTTPWLVEVFLPAASRAELLLPPNQGDE